VSAEAGSELGTVVRPIVFDRALRDPYLGFAVHRVEPGVYAANRDVLTDPDVIVVGQQLRVPQ
jgi:hypothetical protein